MTRTPTPTRSVYFTIAPKPMGLYTPDTPMEFVLLADDVPVRRMYRLYGSFATERILLDSCEHILTLQTADGTDLQNLRLPANDYSYMLTLSEEADFALSRVQPTAQPADIPDLDRLVSLVTGKLMRTLNPASPFCHLYKELTERELDHLWFEFWETAMLIRYMPKSGRIPDLKKDFDSIDRYSSIKGFSQINLTQTLELESRIEAALKESIPNEKLDIYRNAQGFLCVRAK